MNTDTIKEIANKIKAGQVGVIPTDTIYGIVADALDPKAVEKVYEVKGRAYNKPFIILISSIEDLKKLSVLPNVTQTDSLRELWPAPISIVLPCPTRSMQYLHRGTSSLAVRMPDLMWLSNLIKLSGPIVATSANLSGQVTPNDIDKVKKQLPALDFYYEGPVGNEASKIIILKEDGRTVEHIR